MTVITLILIASSDTFHFEEALEKTQKFLKSNMVEADDSHSCL